MRISDWSSDVCSSDLTKPLPKGLIYELLPKVGGLPFRYESRAEEARLIETLNYKKGPSLRGMINGQTNPRGIIKDTILQRLLKNSLSDGALRQSHGNSKDIPTQAFAFITEYSHPSPHS